MFVGIQKGIDHFFYFVHGGWNTDKITEMVQECLEHHKDTPIYSSRLFPFMG